MKKKLLWGMLFVVFLILLLGRLLNNKNEILFSEKDVYKYNVNYEKLQNEVIKEIKEDISNNEYTLDSPMVLLDPFGNSPLTALIVFNTLEETKVFVYINSVFVTTMESDKEHIIPIYGLIENKDNEVRLVLENGLEKTLNIKTDKIDSIFKYQYNGVNNSNSSLFINSPRGKFSLDGFGKVNWYMDNSNYEMEVTSDKKIYLLDNYNRLVETDFMGQVTRMYYVDLMGNNHQLVMLDNGNMMAIDSSFSISEINYETGEVVKVVDLIEILMDVDPEIDITKSVVYMNHFQYVEEDNTILISIRGLDTIIKYDLSEKKIIWMITDNEIFSSKFSNYKLNLVGDGSYFVGQHTPYMKGNYLYVFDNNNCYFNDTNEFSSLGKSSAIIYEINGMDIREVYRYKSDLSSGWYGNFYQYDDSKLINFGSVIDHSEGNYSKVLELDENDNLLWELITDYNNILIYQANKDKFYNEETKNYQFKESVPIITASNYKKYYYFDLGSGSEADAKKKEEEDLKMYVADDEMIKKLANSIIDLGMVKISKVSGIEIDTDRDYEVIFINKENKYYRLSLKNDGYRYLYFNDFISKINGEYAIYVKINKKYYDTGVIFDVR